MTRSRRENFRSWVRDLPTVVIRLLLVLVVVPMLFVGAWEGGIKEVLLQFLEEWRAAGDPKIEKGTNE